MFVKVFICIFLVMYFLKFEWRNESGKYRYQVSMCVGFSFRESKSLFIFLILNIVKFLRSVQYSFERFGLVEVKKCFF